MPALKQKAKSDGGVQAVSLALQIIEELAFSAKPRSITELANNLGTTKTRIFNYLRTLVEHGYAAQDPDTERYRVGVRVSQIGAAAANEFDLVTVSRGPMARVHQAFGNTVVLCKFDGTALYSVALLEGSRALRISFPIGFVMGFHSSAQGKLALAFGPPSLLEATIEKGLEPVTEYTITSPDRLRKEVENARKQGWATAPNETMVRVDSIAVPILNKSGHLIGTIAMILFAEDMVMNSIQEELSALQSAAREIAAALPVSV